MFKGVNDFCWGELKNDENHSNFFTPTTKCINEPLDCNFYFNQYYSYDGVLQKEPSLGKITGTVYKSPGINMLECLNIGFKGISGAMCLDNNDNMIGMIIRRGTNLGIMNYCVDKSIPINDTIAQRSIIMPYNIMIDNINSESIKINELI